MNNLEFFLNTHGVWLLIIFIFLYFYFVSKETEVALHSLFSVLTAFIISIILKELFLVPRPFVNSIVVANAGLANFSSLPSTHAAISFALATSVSLHKKRIGILIFMLAAIISIGRVAANVHYPIDIALGVMIGVLSGMFFDTVHFSNRRKK